MHYGENMILSVDFELAVLFIREENVKNILCCTEAGRFGR